MNERSSEHNSAICEKDHLWIDGTDLHKSKFCCGYCTRRIFFIFMKIVYDVSLKWPEYVSSSKVIHVMAILLQRINVENGRYYTTKSVLL